MASPLETTVGDDRAHALRAEYHARFHGVPELPVPVTAIAEDLLGLRIVERPLEASGLLYPAERLVVINAAESPVRRRFTLAHELGHWVCQCLEGAEAPVFCRHQDVSMTADRALEREANVFAADLLMPAGAVAELHAEAPQSLADRLAVSGPALGWRLYNLGLVAEKPA
jgi:Zn-dependent peptidase ImmA (M78 family)